MQVVYGDGGFDALAYGEAHPNVARFIDEQAGRLNNAISDAGRQFMGYVGGLVDRVSNAEITQRIQALTSKAASMWDRDAICTLTTLFDFQQAKSKMRRWVMAEPTVRKLYHQQRVEGYDDGQNPQYIDVEPDRIGTAHYDYRRATDGLVVFDDDGEWSSTTYFEELREGDRDLTLSEQVHISLTWERLREHLDRASFDPTSLTNAAL